MAMVAATRPGSAWASVACGMAARTIAVVVVIVAMTTTIVAVNGEDGMMVGARTITATTGAAVATATIAGTATDGGLIGAGHWNR